MSEPLILTLDLDEDAFARFDALRRAHFPPERNFIPAHLTLFHHLPGDGLPLILRDLDAAASGQAPIRIDVTGPRSIGRGVAFFVDSDPLAALRGRLARRWAAWLTPQDRQGFRPHVTVQNKVAVETARATLAALQASFAPFQGQGVGLRLWRYRGGPWEAVAAFPFDPHP